MDIFEIRRVQLRRLIDQRFEGNVKRCAEALGMAPPQLHRWLTRTAKVQRSMEWESARKIEAKVSLEDGWMDRDSEGVVKRQFSEDAMALSTRLVREAEEQIGARFSHDEFWRLVKAVAEVAGDADKELCNADEDRFKLLIVKLFTLTKNGESHL